MGQSKKDRPKSTWSLEATPSKCDMMADRKIPAKNAFY